MDGRSQQTDPCIRTERQNRGLPPLSLQKEVERTHESSLVTTQTKLTPSQANKAGAQ
jgi:hypothetical protein